MNGKKIRCKEKYMIITNAINNYTNKLNNGMINKKLTVSLLCIIAKVSVSGYYKWKSKLLTEDKDNADYILIKEIFEKHNNKRGWRMIKMTFEKESNIIMNHKKIRRIMNKYGLITQTRRANPYKKIMKATSEHKTFENIVSRNFSVDMPLKVLSTDITYIYYGRGQKAYLSVIKDICTREIVAWNVSQTLEISIVIDTINKLKNCIDIKQIQNTVIHSDQGVHYTCPQYSNRIKELGMIQSMSRRGNCLDNAPIESFFGHMKDESEYKSCRTFEELIEKINEYMIYYNTMRYQWELKKLTPVEYRNQLLVA